MKKLNGSIAVLIVSTIVWFLQPLQSQCMAAEPERISVDQLKSLLDSQADVIVVDTRGERSYKAGHIPGAISMPFPDGIRSRNQELPRDKTTILY
jgi:3-mercaptopyruvate sulfurtransferase SseA